MDDYSDIIIRLLERYDIPYWEAGKNVSEGITVNVECPLCSDISNHCGIFRNSMEFQGPKSRKSFRFLGGTPKTE